MFLVAIGAGIAVCMQNLLFTSAAASFTAKLRSLLFRAVLGQESTQLAFVHPYVSAANSGICSPIFRQRGQQRMLPHHGLYPMFTDLPLADGQLDLQSE
jgi:hypothetical protein